MSRRMLRAAPMALAAIVACVGLAETAAAADIRIGLLLAGGRYSAVSEDIAAGLSQALAESKNAVGQRRIEVLRVEGEAQPADTAARARRLIELGADVLVGPASAREITALRDVAHEQRTPLVIPTPSPAAMVGLACSPYALYLAPAGDQVAAPLGSWAGAQKAGRRIYLLAPDDQAARNQVAAFRRQFEATGGEVLGEEYVPEAANLDFSPYFAKLRLVGADAIYAPFAGEAAAALSRDFTSLGLAKRVALFGPGSPGLASDAMRAPHLPEGAIGAVDYTPALDTPENKKFVAEFTKRFDRQPTSAAARGYDAGRLILAALNAVDGRADDHPLLAAALARASFVGPRGAVRGEQQRTAAVERLYIVRASSGGERATHELLDQTRPAAAALCAPGG